ncbi:hypothetical protein K458DRAFT_279145, partial [Lentithecium fluviatile CBS 122367]
GHLNIVKLLLRLGVDAETCIRSLYIAAIKGKPEIAEALIDHGCNVHGDDDGGETPLTCALQNRHDEVVRLLCTRGANLAAEEE